MSQQSSSPEDDLEEQIYELLNEALYRAECSARAAARLEYDLVVEHQEQQVVAQEEEAEKRDKEKDEEESEDGAVSAQQSAHEFSMGQFQGMFSNLNVLRLVGDLISLLDLGSLEDEINLVLISDMFRSRAAATAPRRGGEGQTFIGNDLEAYVQGLRRAAEQKQRLNRSR